MWRPGSDSEVLHSLPEGEARIGEIKKVNDCMSYLRDTMLVSLTSTQITVSL